DALGEVVAVGLPLVYAFVVWCLCIMLFAIIVPSHHSHVRGIRRAMKHGRMDVRPFDDDSASLAVYALFTVVAVGGLAVLLREIAISGFFESFGGVPRSAWRL